MPDYLFSLAEHLATEHGEMLKELKSLAGNIDHIKEIVAMQQNYAKVLGVLESLPVADLVEDALRLNSGAMERHHVNVLREYSQVPTHPRGQAQGAANPGEPDPQRQVRPG